MVGDRLLTDVAHGPPRAWSGPGPDRRHDLADVAAAARGARSRARGPRPAHPSGLHGRPYARWEPTVIEFIFMLTHSDRTVPNARAVYDEIRDCVCATSGSRTSACRSPS